jgi:hypothetical protein
MPQNPIRRGNFTEMLIFASLTKLFFAKNAKRKRGNPQNSRLFVNHAPEILAFSA